MRMTIKEAKETIKEVVMSDMLERVLDDLYQAGFSAIQEGVATDNLEESIDKVLEIYGADKEDQLAREAVSSGIISGIMH
jgi:hypothetical protein